LTPKGDQPEGTAKKEEEEEEDDVAITVDFRDKGQMVTVEVYRGEEWIDFKNYMDSRWCIGSIGLYAHLRPPGR
jgi:hypothetical protein